MKKLWGRKTAQAVTILGGSDGPTSVFLAGKFTRQTFLRSLKGRYMDSRMKRRRARVIKHLAAEPHTPKELERYLKKKYHAREYAPSSSRDLRIRKAPLSGGNMGKICNSLDIRRLKRNVRMTLKTGRQWNNGTGICMNMTRQHWGSVIPWYRWITIFMGYPWERAAYRWKLRKCAAC